MLCGYYTNGMLKLFFGFVCKMLKLKHGSVYKKQQRQNF